MAPAAGLAAGRAVRRARLASVLAVQWTVALVAAAGLWPLGLDRFGLLHLVYLQLTLGLAVVGVGVGVALGLAPGPGRPPPGRAWFRRLLGAGLVLPGLVGLYATHVAPFRLRTDRATLVVPPARAGDGDLTIGVLADLQTDSVGDHERAAFRRLMDAAPDVIVVPGDLVQGDDADVAGTVADVRDLLAGLSAPGGVFAVRGDVDPHHRVPDLYRGTTVRYLDDEVVEITVGDRRLLLGGLNLDDDPAAAARVRRALADRPPDTIGVLVAHRPDVALDLAAGDVDLVIAGHTHGGQVVVPGFGPLVTLSAVPRDVARGGLHDLDGVALYVSTGVGLERDQAPQVRLFSRPSIGVLTLTG